MRPPEFTGGNEHAANNGDLPNRVASMRPPEFTGGNDGDADVDVPELIGLQ